MKKITLKSLFVAGFASLIIGLVMVLTSLTTGGLDKLRQLNKPVTVTKTYTDLKSIEMTGMMEKYVTIVPSDDDRIHLTYRYWEDDDNSKVDFSDKNGKLMMTGKQPETPSFSINGGLNVISKLMNSSVHQPDQIFLNLPKNITLETLHIDTGGSVYLEQAHIKELKVLNTFLKAHQLTVDKGVFTNGHFKNSHLKNIEMRSYGSTSFDKTVVENADINYNGDFIATDSTFKNATIKSDYAPLTLKNSTLDNSNLSFNAAPITADNLTILGNVKMTSAEYLVDIDLSDTSQNTINLDLNTSEYGALAINSNLTDITHNGQIATRTKEGQQNKLTIINEHADIKLR